MALANLKNTSIRITGNLIIEPPHARYLSSGGIGEKIFEVYCKNNGLNFSKPFFLMWAVYLNYCKTTYGKLKFGGDKKFKEYNCAELLSLLNQNQLEFLTKSL